MAVSNVLNGEAYSFVELNPKAALYDRDRWHPGSPLEKNTEAPMKQLVLKPIP